MNSFTHVPPGFRFHPTDEELVDYYLRKKIASKRIDLDVIKDIDLYKIEPWDLQELCRIGTEEQNDWYFFSHKDKKYPTGTRTNRATKAGFWKATGRDKAIYTKHSLIGMRKTLVFYKGRAPNGQKSDWIMHEYRLETNENATPQAKFDPPRRISSPFASYQCNYTCKQELELQYNMPNDAFLQLPNLESPKVQQSTGSHMQEISDQIHHNTFYSNTTNEQAADQVTDWRVLDKFVASQLSQDDANNTNEGSNEMKRAAELTSMSTSTSQVDLNSWKLKRMGTRNRRGSWELRYIFRNSVRFL
ncbi:hypothetical protein Pfo_010260 [Paulownia fortunei]|nr:hypothetical protein Pfo_010260 [Paulownia fortunei]